MLLFQFSSKTIVAANKLSSTFILPYTHRRQPFQSTDRPVLSSFPIPSVDIHSSRQTIEQDATHNSSRSLPPSPPRLRRSSSPPQHPCPRQMWPHNPRPLRPTRHLLCQAHHRRRPSGIRDPRQFSQQRPTRPPLRLKLQPDRRENMHHHDRQHHHHRQMVFRDRAHQIPSNG